MSFKCIYCGRTWPDDYLPDEESEWSAYDACEQCREREDEPPEGGVPA